MNKEEILKALNWRSAIKIFDPEKKLKEDEIRFILEVGRLAPSSSGFEPWKFIVVKDKTLREKLYEVSFNQSKVKDASDLIVITYRTDLAQNGVKDLINRTANIEGKKEEELQNFKKAKEDALNIKIADGTLEEWAQAQTYIPLGMMIETAALLGIDATPMEGFEAEKVDQILKLPEKNLKSITMLVLGKRGDDPYSKNKKVRRDFEDVVEFI